MASWEVPSITRVISQNPFGSNNNVLRWLGVPTRRTIFVIHVGTQPEGLIGACPELGLQRSIQTVQHIFYLYLSDLIKI